MMIRVVGVVLLLCLLRNSLQLSTGQSNTDHDKQDDSGSTVYFFGFFVNPDKCHSADLKLILINTDSHPVSYLMEAPGIGYIRSGNISASEKKIVDIPSEAEVSSIDDQNKGIYLTTTSDNVTVIGQSINGNSTDTFTLLPVASRNAEKYTYYTISTGLVSPDGHNNTILVVGTEDNTTLELTVTREVQVKISNNVDNLVPDNMYSFAISKFQTVYISTEKDLSGTKVTTDKPVSVFSGHQFGYVDNWSGGNYLAEQIPPTANWDNVYYFANTGQSKVRILAAENFTIVNMHCDGIKESYMIHEGETAFELFDYHRVDYCAVYSNKPVLVVLLGAIMKYNSGDPMMATVLGENQYTYKIASSTLNPEDSCKIYHHYINLVVLEDYYQPDMIHLTQAGETHTLTNSDWRAITADGVNKAYAVQLSIKAGPYIITHDNTAAKMTVTSFGIGDEKGGYGHSVQQIRAVQVPPLCQVLENIDNGKVECSLGVDEVPTEGDTCIYVCDEGFVAGGSSVRECQSNGSWSGSEPTCERVSCYQLQAPDNGKMECTGNHYEDVCTFSCDDSYELTGSDSRTCQSDAAWSGSETECVPGLRQDRNHKQKKAGKRKNKDRDQKQEL